MNTKNVLQWLENQEKMDGNRIGFGDVTSDITYHDLVRNSQIVGTYLLQKETVRRPITFYLEKSNIALAGMFGAIYAGCFYSLLDTRQPYARLHSILEILDSHILLTDETFYDQAFEMFGKEIEVVKIEDILSVGQINASRLSWIRRQSLDTDPLYVNFTSGSTGTPKGVTVCHRSVIDFIEIFESTFGITKNDIIGNQAPFDFDVSVKDIYTGLYTGAKVQLIPREYFSNPTALMDYICDKHVSVLIWAVSAMCFVSIMNGFGYRTPMEIRLVMFSGEVMPMKQFNKWKKAIPHATYVNLYGPTEITCNCTYHVLEDREYGLDEIIPIGEPFTNEKVFLLDEEDHLVQEVGKSGEICVCGTCLALGYYHDLKKTNEVFVQNPLQPNYLERMYRTGDLGYYNENEELVYLSRKDFQIKHMGHRIELGEIETQVQAMDGISRACCIYDTKKKRIHLFYTGSEDGKELLTKLRDVLPPFMLPNKLTCLENMPLNKNGKIDRNELKKIGGIA